MTKYCSGCTEHLLLCPENFNKKRVRADGTIQWQGWCRTCNKTRSRQYHADNRERHNKVINARTRRMRQSGATKIAEYLKKNPCVDCGENDIVVLEFDHRNPIEKLIEVTRAVTHGWSWRRIEIEIAKCDVRCANCHRRRTARSGNHFRFHYGA